MDNFNGLDEILPMVLPRSEHEAREKRGRELATVARTGIRQVGRHYVVPSQTDPAASYLVDLEESRCTCPDFETRGVRCKHQHAVEFSIIWEQTQAPDGTVTETLTVKRKTYAQNWPAYNAAQMNEKPLVEKLARDLCSGIQDPARVPGRGGRPTKPLRDKTFDAIMKVASLKSARRAMGHIAECVEKGYVEDMSCSTILDFFKAPSTTPLLMWLVQESAAPLAVFETAGQFAIDSTGFSTVVYERWFDEKHGKLHSQHPFIKLHAFAGTQTNVVTAVRVTRAGDCTQLPALLDATRERFDVTEVSADKAYLSYENLEAIEAAGAVPYIPLKINSVMSTRSDAWERNRCRFYLQAAEWAPKYHRRSNVETTFQMIKAAFGGGVRSKLKVAQVNEVLCKVIAHNLCCLVHAIYEHGLQPDFWPSWTPSRPLTVVR